MVNVPQGGNPTGVDNPYEMDISVDVTATTPIEEASVPNIDATQYETPTEETSSTPLVDFDLGKESEWSKIRKSGVSKEESEKEMKIRFQLRTADGENPDDVYKELMGDGTVSWDREAYEQTLDLQKKTNEMSAMLGGINISMEDIVTGNMSDEQRNIIKQVGEHGVKQGLFKFYNPNNATAYTKDGIPIRLNDAGFGDIISANNREISGSIAGGILLPLVANPATAVPATGLAIVGSMGGTYAGRISDILRDEAKLKELGVDYDPMNAWDLNREGAVAAVTDGALAKAVSYIGAKGTQLTRSLYQSLMGRNTTSAINTITELTGLGKDKLVKRAEDYARSAGVKLDADNFEDVNNMILRNEIENNPALQGYLTRVVEEPVIAQQLRQSVKERTATVQAIGASTKVDDLVGMFTQSQSAVQRMMGSVRGALDDTFANIPINLEALTVHTQKIKDSLAPYANTIEERGALSDMDTMNDTIRSLSTSPSIGTLFKLRTDYGNLLKKMGFFAEKQADRSAKLGTVDTNPMMALYKTIDKQIDSLITNTPFLEKAQKAQLLNMKKTSDSLYSSQMKAINTSWVKGLYSEGATSKQSLDKLLTLATENRHQYNEIMESLTKTNQDGLEQSMIKRALDKAEIGEDGYNLSAVANDLVKLRPKIKNPQILDKIDAVSKVASIFKQDPVVSMISNNRMVLDKLAKAGLTYDPKASLMYAMWSKTFPRLQVAMVELMEKTPILNKIAPAIPLYGAIKTSAKEINLTKAATEAMLRGERGSFMDFLDRALRMDDLPPLARRSIEDISKQYTKLADSFQAHPEEVEQYMKAIRENPDRALPAPASASQGVRDKFQVVAQESSAKEGTKSAEAIKAAQQLELQGVDKQLKKQQGNVNKEINALFKTRLRSSDDKLEFDRIQETIISARNQGDREAVQSGLDELETFNRYMKTKPSKETTKEASTRIAIEQTQARKARIAKARASRARREKEATARRNTEEAEEALRVQATRKNAERVAIARREQRAVRESEAREVVTTTPLSQEARRVNAYDTVVSSLNKTHAEGWELTSGGNHPTFTNTDPANSFVDRYGRAKQPSFDLHIYGDEIGATTTGLPNGGGVGQKVYYAVFDMAEELGGVYTPSSALLTANPTRMSMNMLTYMMERGGDNASHIRFSHSQKAIGRRGDSNYLGGKLLTEENAKQLGSNMKRYINRQLPNGINVDGRTSDKAIERMAQVTGTDSNVRIGVDSLKKIRELARAGMDFRSLSIAFGVILADDELMNIIDGDDL